MGTQEISTLEPLAEVCINVRSEGGTINKASHDGRTPTSPEDYLRKTNQSKTIKVHVEMGSEGIATDKTSQDSGRPTSFEVYPCITNQSKVKEDMSTDKAPQEETRAKIKVAVTTEYRELFEAAVRSNWKDAEKFLKEHEEAMTAEVLSVGGKPRTVLQVAVLASQDQFVENLVNSSRQEYDIRILKKALKSAAMRGRLSMVKALVDKIEEKGKIEEKRNDASASISHALSKAISHAPMRREVIRYLASRTTLIPDPPTIHNLIMAGHLDTLLYLTRRHEESMKFNIEENMTLLKDLAKLESYFPSGARFTFLEKCIYKCVPLRLFDASFGKPRDRVAAATFIKRIGELKLRHKCSSKFLELALSDDGACEVTPKILGLTSEVVLEAASHGISEIVKLCLKRFPELMWDAEFAQKLLQEVISGRQVELFRLASAHLGDSSWTEMQLIKTVIEYTPRCACSAVSGPAFRMQRELQWYKVVEDRIEPSRKTSKSSGRLIEPWEKKRYWKLFIDKRGDLLKEARQWMKSTSSSCSLVATLIITVAFTAAFAVPGGNNDKTGIPIFLKEGSFMAFAIADAFALFSSVTAILMFLSILTSRYAIEDFRHSLPSKMILGLTFLFLSLVFILVAFGSALTMVLNKQLKWICIPVSLLATFPIILFVMLHFFLFVEMVESTFRPSLYRPKRFWK